MTDEELADQRRRAAHCTTHHNACDCRELALAEEVARLRTRANGFEVAAGEIERWRQELAVENAAMHALLERVAAIDSIVPWGIEYRVICGVCCGHQPLDEDNLPIDDAPIEHAADCPVTLVRAFLADHPA